MKSKCAWLLFIFFFLNNYCKAQVTITGSVAVNGTYATLDAAFAAITATASQAGADILLTITADLTEPSGNPLLYRNWNSLTIQPAGARTVTGNPGTELIGLSGTRYVTINGINSGGNSLLINCTGSAPAIRITGGASYNTIKNCTIRSNTNFAFGGVVTFGPSGGNNNNVLDNCDITPSSGTSAFNLVFSYISTGGVNRADTIRNCRLYNNFSATSNANGILLDPGNDSWVIENNDYWQSATRATTSGAPVYTAININGCLGDKFKINNNRIGGTSSSHTGYTIYGPNTQGPVFRGIVLNNVGPASAAYPSNSYVTNNTIRGIQVNSNRASTVKGNNVFVGIEVNNGATTDEAYITNNTIGSSGTDLIRIDATSTTTNQVPCIGIYQRSSKGNIIEYNNIGSVSIYTSGATKTTTFSAIYADALTNSNTSISYNNIGGSGIRTVYGLGRVYGIELANTNTSGTSYTVTHNSISNLSHTASSTNIIYPLAGINCVGGGDQATIAYNEISNISLTGNITSTQYYIAGIRAQSQTGGGAQPNRIYSNKIYSLSTAFNTNQYAGIIGISLLGDGTHYVYNNMINVGEGSSASQVNGVNQNGANTAYLYNNSIYVSGGLPSEDLSACVRKYSANCSITAINNIFRIDRNGYGLHFFNIPDAATYTANNNLFYTPGGNVARITGTTYPALANFRLGLPAGNTEGTGSKEAEITFTALPLLNTQDPDVINAGMNLLAATPLAIAEDIDGDARNACFDIGADEVYFYPGTPNRLTWTGSTDTKWCTPCNWDRGIAPDSLYTVFIEAGMPRYPVIDATHNCSVTLLPHADSVNIASGATLTINSSALEIYGQLNNNGTITNPGGSIAFASSIKDQQINSTTDLVFNNLYIKGLATRKYLNRNTTLNTFAHCAACDADLLLGTSNLTVNTAATGSLNSHIVTNGTGNLLMKNIAVAGRFFPIGPDEASYNPITIANGDGKDYTARVETGINPGGTANPLLGINRTWNMTASSTPAAAVDVTFSYYNTDVNGMVNPTANMYLGHYYTTPIPIWNIDQANRPVTPGTPNSVLFNISNWNASNPFVIGNMGFLLAHAQQVTLAATRQTNSCSLLWNVAGSGNVEKFELQRSADGILFNSISLVHPVGGSTNYRFTDMPVGNSTVFYRVKMTTTAGETIYSNIAVAQNRPAGNDMLVIYPSPARGKATVLIHADKSQNITYYIVDTQGRQLLSAGTSLVAGLNTISLNLHRLPAGDYFIKAGMGEGKIKTGRFVKQ